MLKKDFKFALSVFFAILRALVAVASAYLLKRIVDAATLLDSALFANTLKLGIAFILFEVVLFYISQKTVVSLIKDNLQRVKINVFRTIFNSDEKIDSSETISMLNNDMNLVSERYYGSIFTIIESIFTAIFALVYMLYLNVWLTLLVLAISLLPVIVSAATGPIVSKALSKYTNYLTNYVREIKEYIMGKTTIKSFNLGNTFLKRYQKTTETSEQNRYDAGLVSAKINAINLSIFSVVSLGSIAVGTYFVLKGQITVGIMIAATQLSNNIVNPIYAIANTLIGLKSVQEIIEKIEKYNIAESELVSPNENRQATFNNSIVVDNITFSYDAKAIFSNASYSFLKDKKYLLVGGSGCGKSTLLKLIMNSLKPQEGEILLDGKSLINYSETVISKTMAMIHQDVFLFNASMYDNVTLFTDFSEEEVKEAFEKASLTKYIPEWNKIIEEGGANFSGGEKQRIAIARAVLRKTPVLLIDEMTSSLDPQTAKEVENVILNLKDTTCIIISHNISGELLSKVDEVIKVEDKKLINLAKNNL